MGKIYVIADIHGAYQALKQCLELANFDYRGDRLILLGDIVDGHPEVYECVEELLKIDDIIALKGNHDDWFLDFLSSDYHPVTWNKGGEGTLISYLKHAGKPGMYMLKGNGYKTALVKEDIPPSHRNFFKKMRPYYIDEQNRCFLHAGFNRHFSFYKQAETAYWWDRDLWTDALSFQARNELDLASFYFDCDFTKIYIGHSPTVRCGIDKPMKALNIINIDTGAGHNGRLTIMNVDTQDFYQSNPVGEFYPEAGHKST